jgi:hypothetical protein
MADMISDTTVEVKGSKEVSVRSTGHEKTKLSVMLTAKANGTKYKPHIQGFAYYLPVWTGLGNSWYWTLGKLGGKLEIFINSFKTEIKRCDVLFLLLFLFGFGKGQQLLFFNLVIEEEE